MFTKSTCKCHRAAGGGDVETAYGTAGWRDVLGDEQENPSCRKRIGDFACYLVFVNALLAR